ncbi:MAG: hypothetical protein N2050_09025 [Flavobacteriales bacterium]|nr:hypothetical protein [Flavobacteriales bacterium]
MRDAEGGSFASAQEAGAGTALRPQCGRRDCRSGSGARSSPTPGGPSVRWATQVERFNTLRNGRPTFLFDGISLEFDPSVL